MIHWIDRDKKQKDFERQLRRIVPEEDTRECNDTIAWMVIGFAILYFGIHILVGIGLWNWPA